MAILVAFLVAVVATNSVQSLNCNEGFNFSIAGVPLYYWTERSCVYNSECFMQELRSDIYSTGVEVGASYGGCISSSYSPIITCQKLFGENSDLNPTVLMNMIPDLQKKIEDVFRDFRAGFTAKFKELFSSGKGRDEFIAGCYQFLENLGFNTEKARPLEKPISDLLEAILSFPTETEQSDVKYSERINIAVDSILATLGQLDTRNSDISENLYAFFDNWIYLEIRGTKYAPLVENLPELIRSALPTNLKPELWFDAVFDIMGDFDSDQPTQTAKDMVETIKTYWDMTKSWERYINLILDSIPGLVDLLTGEGGEWMAVLQRYSTRNTETGRLAAAVTRIIRTFYMDLPPWFDNVQTTIEWLPGVAYYLFPDEITEIDRVYNVLSDGLEATDFTKPIETMERTNMSDFVLLIIEKTGLFSQIGPEGQKESKQTSDLVIINAAKTVYNLIPEYTDKLDTVFSALLNIFEDYRYFNATNLVLNLGGEVPREMKPILDNIPNVLSTFYNDTGLNFQPEEFLTEIARIITEYKDMYPESDIPSIVERLINFTYEANRVEPLSCSYPTDWWNDTEVNLYLNCTTAYYKKLSEISRQRGEESLNISIDLQFAVFKALDYPGNQMFKALVDAFPDLELYLKAMRLLDSSDMKELYVQYMNWMYDSIGNMQPMTVESLLKVINTPMEKIMAKLDEVVKDMRVLFSPDSCKYVSCGEDMCNKRDELIPQEPFTRDPSKRKFGQKYEAYSPPGSSGEVTNPTMLLNAIALWVLAKIFT